MARLLTSPRGWAVDDLREQLGIQERTWRKYRQLLVQYGPSLFGDSERIVPREITEDGRRFIRLVPPAFVDKASGFAERLMALSLLRGFGGLAEGSSLGRIAEETWAGFVGRVRDKQFVVGSLLRDLDRKVYHRPAAPKDYTEHGHTIDEVGRAVLLQRRLSMRYASAASAERDRVVEPLTLLHWRGGLYLIARCVGGEGLRTFAVERILSASLQGNAPFDYPSAADYDPERFFDGAFGLFRGDAASAESTSVRLRFAATPWLHQYVRERCWHPSQQFVLLEDGRLEMRFEVASMTEVWPWIRHFGCDVEVLEAGPWEAPPGLH